MLKKYTKNQSGITLLELLASLTISLIIIGLLSAVLISSFTQTERTQSHIHLRQEANAIVLELRRIHSEGNYQLCYEDEKLFLGSVTLHSLTREQITVRGIEDSSGERILLENNGSTMSESSPADCNSPMLINNNHPLIVTLILIDESGQEYEIDTVIDRLGPYIP
ncbi:type II secretion system GspH family protein [Bacillus shivajii]|uniref:type IV pilin protein n=1 Tax=Bacillus shivajii TaxID=1983719 RepID=UPI001CFC2BA4|nr:type II secretion system protein [Bacillus shivajii]UCZ52142.1 type II secretion system GspH family protein [Bacillus shivajii]